MPGLITGNHLPKPSAEVGAEHDAKVLAFLANEHALTKLRELAIQRGWETSSRLIRKIECIPGWAGCLALKSTKQGQNNTWQRVWVETPIRASVSLDVQPIFDNSIAPRPDSPVFVRQYNPGTEDKWNPGLQVIEQCDGLTTRLRNFELPMGISVEFTGLDQVQLDTSLSEEFRHT